MNKSVKIFITEKDPMTSAIIEDYLKSVNNEFTLVKGDEISDVEAQIDDKALNIFISDISENPEEFVQIIDDLEEKHHTCKFILTSYGLKTDLIVKFLRKSKKDFFTKPIVKTKFVDTVNEIIEKLTSAQDFSGHGKVISVFSNKGGLGKTTLAVNLAAELADSNRFDKIALVDMNMFLGDITTFLDICPPYDIKFIAEKAAQSEDIEDLPAQYRHKNLFVIADSPFRDFTNTIPANAVITLFNALRKHFKYIIVDCSSAITGKTKNIFDISDLILLISEANLPTIKNCKRCLDFFERINVAKKTKLILNRFAYDDEVQVEDIEKFLHKKVFMKIPNDWQTVVQSINKGRTIGEIAHDSSIQNSYIAFTEAVIKLLCR